MNSISQELVKIAALVESGENNFKKNRKLWSDIDMSFEKYEKFLEEEFGRGTTEMKSFLKAKNNLYKVYTVIDKEMYLKAE